MSHRQLIPPSGVVVSVGAGDKLGEVFKTLLTHNILSAPVYDEKAKAHVAVVDIQDILSATVLLDEQKEMGAQFAQVQLPRLSLRVLSSTHDSVGRFCSTL